VTVVVSTHFDDAVLSCFEPLAGATVVTVLGGLPPEGVLGWWDEQADVTDSRAHVERRREEDRCALALAVATPVHLDFPDGQYWRPWGLRGLRRRAWPRGPRLHELVAALSPYLTDAPSVFAPAGIDNPHHRLVRDAVLLLRPEATLYADMPYAYRHGYDFPLASGPERVRREVTLDAETAARKLEAARCYATQLPGLLAKFGDFEDALATEIRWEVES